MKKTFNTRHAVLSLSLLALMAGPGLAQAHDDVQHHDEHHEDRGAGPDHKLHRGDRLPANYRGHEHVVDDWRGHHLSEPPRGYHWVHVGDDYVLAAVATGVILQLFLSN